MSLSVDFKTLRGSEEVRVRCAGQWTQQLTTGRDQEETESGFEYEVVADGPAEIHTVRMSDFLVNRAREYGFDMLEDPAATDELFDLKYSKVGSDSRMHAVSFADLDSLRARGKG